MPKLSSRAPKYARHKASGQAVVKFAGRRHYLGPYGSQESKVRYQEAIAQWASTLQNAGASHPPAVPALPEVEHTVRELILRFFEHAEVYYCKHGQPTGTTGTLRPILRQLREMFGQTLVKDFRPSFLEAYQQRMIERGVSRKYINDAVGRIKRMFRWGVAKEIVPVEVLQRLEAVDGLAKGRTEARETEPVVPVDDATVEVTLPYLPEVVADMVRFQRLTGARPGEVCAIRPCDVDRSGDVWRYMPGSHKTEHHGRERVVFIGPRAQAILMPYLLRESTAFCFSPAESERGRNAARREARETPMTPSQEARKAKRRPKRPKGDRYKKDAYCRAIARACDLAFPPPPPLARLDGESARKRNERLTATQRAELKAWQAAHRWAPNQLRHTAGTAVRRQFGLEAAQVVLGHSRADVTQVYAERDQRLAVEVARQVG